MRKCEKIISRDIIFLEAIPLCEKICVGLESPDAKMRKYNISRYYLFEGDSTLREYLCWLGEPRRLRSEAGDSRGHKVAGDSRGHRGKPPMRAMRECDAKMRKDNISRYYLFEGDSSLREICVGLESLQGSDLKPAIAVAI